MFSDEKEIALKVTATSFDESMIPDLTILIPTWNNLEYLKLCLRSLDENSTQALQIVLHVNEGTDGTLNWVRENKIDHTHSIDNLGVCHALNQAAKLAKAEYLVYLNDDMYVCPDWDVYLMEACQQFKDTHFFLSSTLIEPKDTNNQCVIVKDFGDDLRNFREADLISSYKTLPDAGDWSGATWPPNLIHRKLWQEVGGLSPEFSPGMYSDPDLSMKLWQAGVRIFKGISKSRVYHFQCKSTGRVKKNDGRRQFMKKWKISSSSFLKYYLRMGQASKDILSEPENSLALSLQKLRGSLAGWF